MRSEESTYLPSNDTGLLGLAKDIRGVLYGTVLTTIALMNGSIAEDLPPERSLFQQATESTDRFGALSPADAEMLLRFILQSIEGVRVQFSLNRVPWALRR